MTDEAHRIDPLESIRLEVERARLAIDQAEYRESATRTFLERWRVDVQPEHEHLLMSRQHAHEFAKVAIQTVFVLNGGALIAFPAFAQLVGTGFENSVGWALSGIAAFVLGLVLIALTTLIAYLSMVADMEAVWQSRERVTASLNQTQVPEAEQSRFDERRAEADAALARYNRISMRLRAWGIALGIGSILAFMVGAACAAVVLSNAAPAP